MMHRFNKITAIFLILVFTQKSGLGLYLHNWLHQNKNPSISYSARQAFNTVQLKCNCIDDALRPLKTAINVFEIKTPEKKLFSFHNEHSSSLSPFTKLFQPLRGPPAAL
jgi:hypothetical protein